MRTGITASAQVTCGPDQSFVFEVASRLKPYSFPGSVNCQILLPLSGRTWKPNSTKAWFTCSGLILRSNAQVNRSATEDTVIPTSGTVALEPMSFFASSIISARSGNFLARALNFHCAIALLSSPASTSQTARVLMDSIAVAIASGEIMPDSGVEPSPVLDMNRVRKGLLDMLRTQRHWCLWLQFLCDGFAHG